VLREAEADAVLFAAGYFTTQDRPYKLVSGLTKQVSMLVRNMKRKPVVCFGVDGRVNGKYSKDQLAVAVGANGVLGLARKFHPTAAESGHIEVATGPLAGERNYPRMIDIMGRRAFMAVCYDGFGIRQCRLANPGVDMIFDLIHGFSPKGEAASGDVYFAKHALAGSSKQWRCPAFGAAVFFRRPVSTKWPSGVIWNQGSTSTQRWKYSDNSLHALCESQVSDGSEKALVRVYRV